MVAVAVALDIVTPGSAPVAVTGIVLPLDALELNNDIDIIARPDHLHLVDIERPKDFQIVGPIQVDQNRPLLLGQHRRCGLDCPVGLWHDAARGRKRGRRRAGGGRTASPAAPQPHARREGEKGQRYKAQTVPR